MDVKQSLLLRRPERNILAAKRLRNAHDLPEQAPVRRGADGDETRHADGGDRREEGVEGAGAARARLRDRERVDGLTPEIG